MSPRAYARSAALLAAAPRPGAPPGTPVTAWTDDMETNLYWSLCADGPDPLLELSAAQHHGGAQSLHGKTRVTGATASDDLGAFVDLPWYETQALSLSAWFYLPNIAHLQTAFWQASLNDGLHIYHAALGWDMPTGDGYYWDATGTPIHAAGLDHIWVAATWTHLVLVLNTQTKRYISAAAAAGSADLSGQLLRVVGPGAARFTAPRANAATADAAPAELYLDDVTVTYTVP